jgi:hypothetical protein
MNGVYHRCWGWPFYLYDDHPALLEGVPQMPRSLCQCCALARHGPGTARGELQTNAYEHAVRNQAAAIPWPSFWTEMNSLSCVTMSIWEAFLAEYSGASAVSLTGTSLAQREFQRPRRTGDSLAYPRKYQASRNVTTIARVSAIESIVTPQHCRLRKGPWLDANRRPFCFEDLYLGKTERAHINHYHCRSFQRWMRRPGRGDAGYSLTNVEWHWKLDPEQCLQKFVGTVALDHNEYEDLWMLRFKTIWNNGFRNAATCGASPGPVTLTKRKALLRCRNLNAEGSPNVARCPLFPAGLSVGGCRPDSAT